MKYFISISASILIFSLFSNCSSAQKLQEKAPITFGAVYFQKWNAGVEEGDTGLNIFIPIATELSKKIQLDSVYFRGKAAKLQFFEEKANLYVGRFKSEALQKPDIVMTSNPKDEYGNKAPNLSKKIPFELQDSECVVSYKDGTNTKYYKIEKIIEKPKLNYPSSPEIKYE